MHASTEHPRQRWPAQPRPRNGIQYNVAINACPRCRGTLNIQQRYDHGRVVDTEAYCQTCGRAYYDTSLPPTQPLTA